MRIIKFRAWHPVAKCMFFDTTVKKRGWTDGEYDLWWATDHVFVMQFTGLKDKNGNEIYEGDILRGGKPEFISDVIGVCKFGGMAFHFAGKKIGGKEDGQEWFFTITSPDWTRNVEVEIIGNIWQNPELLK